MNIDEKHMRLAIRLAKRAEGLTSPNPIVGAVIVKNGKVVGRGYHKMCGMPHAEVNALRQAGLKARGATIYVTLEPCDHFGKTPPCTDALINSGVKRVVIGMKDPNPLNNGKGMKKLNSNGIKTDIGILKDEAIEMNKPFIKSVTKKLPYVTVKTAQSIDGKIATKTGDSKWITSEASRKFVHDLRSSVDAVMVGVNTIIKDDPLLTSRGTRFKKQPIRVVVDSRLSTPVGAKIFSDVKISPVIIVTTKKSDRKKIGQIEKKGARVIILKSSRGGLDLKSLMNKLTNMGIINVLVEGGGNLIAGLVESRLVDKFLFFIAPKIIGGKNAITSVEGAGIKMIKDAAELKNIKLRKIGPDILIEAEAI